MSLYICKYTFTVLEDWELNQLGDDAIIRLELTDNHDIMEDQSTGDLYDVSDYQARKVG